MTAISTTPRTLTLNVLQNMTDEVTFEDIMYELHFLQKVQNGLKDIQEGNVVTQVEVEEEFKQWLR